MVERGGPFIQCMIAVKKVSHQTVKFGAPTNKGKDEKSLRFLWV